MRSPTKPTERASRRSTHRGTRSRSRARTRPEPASPSRSFTTTCSTGFRKGPGISSCRTRRTSVRTRSTRSSPRCATGSRAPRSSVRARRTRSRGARSRCCDRVVRSCSRPRRVMPGVIDGLLGRARLHGRANDEGSRRTRSGGRRRARAMTPVEEAIAAIRDGKRCRHPDGHGVRPRLHAASRGGRASAVRAQGSFAGAADRDRRFQHRVAGRVRSRAVRGGARACSTAAARPVHARPPESCAAASPGSAAQAPRRSAFACRSSSGLGTRPARGGGMSSPPRARTSTADPIRGAWPTFPKRFARAVAAILDGGDLPGTPSTVLDLTGAEPRVLREGAVPAAEALARPSSILAMAIAQLTLEDLRSAGLADVDPEIADLLQQELDRQRGEIELIASENFTWPSMLEAVGSVADEQVLRGLSRAALLRRLRGHGRDRAARDRPCEGAIRRGARERPAACRRADEHGGVLRLPEARATRSSRSSSRTAATSRTA